MIYSCVFLAVLSGCLQATCAEVSVADCAVVANTESGPVCGVVAEAGAGVSYASFRSVPYAKQPLGELRFKELQPAEPWELLDATEYGPICPQTDILYGPLMDSTNQSESCIHANINVPLDALPAYNSEEGSANGTGLPIFVFIHGGGFTFGSGNADVNGPEYMVSQGVIIITFNYRLNVFGFLSLNTPEVPGNNGLRDMVTLLKWVQRNAQYLGGDPAQVTLAGHSAGSAATHLLTLSDAAQGLFQRAIIMSSTALPTFFTTLPTYAQTITAAFTALAGINSTDPEEIYQALVTMPIEDIMAANAALQDQTGLLTFFPVVESAFSGVTQIISADPEELILQGKNKDIPLIVGYTNAEFETFRLRFETIDIVSRLEANPLIILPAPIMFTDNATDKAQRIIERYMGDNITLDGCINAYTNTYVTYSALKVANYKQQVGGAPLYLYRFAYNADYSVIKLALNLTFTGAGHIEDLTYILKVNHFEVPSSESDTAMQALMSSYFANFIKTGNPTEDSTWLPVDSDSFKYLNIESATSHQIEDITEEQQDVLDFYDSIRGVSS